MSRYVKVEYFQVKRFIILFNGGAIWPFEGYTKSVSLYLTFSLFSKVATLGLDQSHLGLSLSGIRDHLHAMHDKYGVNICGEGGEYETFTLDCPLFLKSIVM